jgi:hypothetical protein
MIDDLLRPCEDSSCNEIGDVVCTTCNQSFCEDHFDEHECVEVQ